MVEVGRGVWQLLSKLASMNDGDKCDAIAAMKLSNLVGEVQRQGENRRDMIPISHNQNTSNDTMFIESVVP
jgi:hypothetical protein